MPILNTINRGELYIPSESFYSQLITMREILQVIHGDSPKDGKEWFKRIASEIESVRVDLPKDVITFFAKISVFFKMRKMNSDIRIKRKNTKGCRSEMRKYDKIVK